jgi:SAM-dependent methyltransferase
MSAPRLDSFACSIAAAPALSPRRIAPHRPIYALELLGPEVLQLEPLVEDAFKSGGGVDWGDHAGCLFCAIGAMLRPRYSANIVQKWLPALDGVVAKLERGAKVGDIGCGTGYSTFIMARAFPNSTFVGYDFHEPSVEHATAHARQSGGAGNVVSRWPRQRIFLPRILTW